MLTDLRHYWSQLPPARHLFYRNPNKRAEKLLFSYLDAQQQAEWKRSGYFHVAVTDTNAAGDMLSARLYRLNGSETIELADFFGPQPTRNTYKFLAGRCIRHARFGIFVPRYHALPKADRALAQMLLLISPDGEYKVHSLACGPYVR